MPRSRTSAADKVLAAMVKDYKRLRRSLASGAGGADPELAALLQRKKELSSELRELRARIAAARRSPSRSLSPRDSEALERLREAIAALSSNLGITLELD